MSVMSETAFSEGLLAFEEHCKLEKQIQELQTKQRAAGDRYEVARRKILNGEETKLFLAKCNALQRKVFG